jgi:5-methylcytosine-specific restriction endonuclease McrA
MLARKRQNAKGVTYQTIFIKTKQGESRYPLCARHRLLLKKHNLFCRGLTRIWQNPTRDYGVRALSSRGTRLVLFDRAGEKCETCALPLDFNSKGTWNLDHVVPVFKGGLTTLANLRVLCKACHDSKSAAEKSETALKYWAGRREPVNRWFTHPQKDALIAQLRQEVAELQAKLEDLRADDHVSV